MPNIPIVYFTVRCCGCRGHLFDGTETYWHRDEIFCVDCAFSRRIYRGQPKESEATQYVFRQEDFSASYNTGKARRPLLPCRHPNQGLCGNSFACQEDCW